MQRLPNHVRDMLSTRNPSDNWNKMVVKPMTTYVHKPDGQIYELSDAGTEDVLDAIIVRIKYFERAIARAEERKDHPISTLQAWERHIRELNKAEMAFRACCREARQR